MREHGPAEARGLHRMPESKVEPYLLERSALLGAREGGCAECLKAA